MNPDEYCRAIEAYLCRKNDGHLIRIVGPSFERVCAWEGRGVPLRVAFGGIDRYFERYYARGPRRRPVRIDFCEADVLDLFDEWRRAVGVRGVSARSGADETKADETDKGAGRRRLSLPGHLDRVIARLTLLRGGEAVAPGFQEALDRCVREVDGMRAAARRARGQTRADIAERLAALDRHLVDAARDAATPEALRAFRREAEVELEPFRARMPTVAFEQATAACLDRLLRDSARLPQLAID